MLSILVQGSKVKVPCYPDDLTCESLNIEPGTLEL